MSGIVLSYIGVHQIFQLALAAQEMGELDQLYCSLIDLPGKWGGLSKGRITAASLHPMGAENLSHDRITEIPLPMLARHLAIKLGRQSGDFFHTNHWFDRTVSRKIKRHSTQGARVYAGVETCALESLRVAGQCGMKRVLDCPGIAAEFLALETKKASEELGINCPLPDASPRLRDLKEQEMAEADLLLFCSEVQRRHYLKKGISAEKMRINPLWVDPVFVGQSTEPKSSPLISQPLKALFVGAATVSKGVPYVINAVAKLKGLVSLTFCGNISESVQRWAGSRLDSHHHIPWVSRSELKNIYMNHDVLVFPTLGDSFGFVALEAMSCGLPVIATTNAGAPLPSETWRVPPRDAESLTQRLAFYAENRDALQADAELAQQFAAGFTPEAYRQRAITIFRELLN